MTRNCPSFVRHQSLEATHVIPLFDSTSTTFTSIPPFKPKAGEVYLLKLDVGHENDWRSDGYRWVQIAARRLPSHNPVIKKCYFHVAQKNKKKSKDFEKQAFVSLVDPSKVIVQYLGDENLAEEFPHGNSKKNTKPFFRTRPSLLNKLISEASTNTETSEIFKQFSIQNNDEQENNLDDQDQIIEKTKSKFGPEMLSQPRNIEQIRNVKRRLARRFVASADEISELYRFARETPNYIVRLTLIPNIVAVAFTNESMHEFNLLLDHSEILSQKVLITFDSSFTINTFHATCVFYRHVAMKEEPCILLGCALHNRRSDDVYEYILTYLKRQCPNIESRCLFIIDNDANILNNNYLSIFLPGLPIIHTWNYVFNQLRTWLLDNGRTNADCQFYIAEIKSLFLCSDFQIFTRSYERCQSKWTEEFRTYFEQIILPLVDTNLGSWILKKYNLFDSNSNVKGLVCDQVQTLSAQLRDWRESRIDSGAMVYYWLQMYFVQQIRKSYSHLESIYNLKRPLCDKWAIVAISSITAHEPIKALTLEKIVDHVRTKINLSRFNNNNNTNGQLKRSNDQQILTLSTMKRPKITTTTTFDNLQPTCLVATTSDFKPSFINTFQQPATMTIRRIATTTNSQQVTTVSPNQRSHQFIITTTDANLPINQTGTSKLIDCSTDLTGCLISTSSQTGNATTIQTRPAFVRPVLPTNVLRLTVIRK